MHPLSPYQQLQQLVQSGKLEIINVIGLPRSNGTAVHLALAQSAGITGQLNEPFYYPDLTGRRFDYIPPEKPVRTFDEGCQFILKRYEEENSTGKVKLIIHELSQNLTDTEFRKILALNSHQVFVIRDPLKQALSVFMRYVNDKLSQPGGDKIKAQEAIELMRDPETLQAYAAKNPDKISLPLICKLIGKPENTKLTEEDFNLAYKKVIEFILVKLTIPWENIHHFFKVAEVEYADHPQTVFDGGWLFDKPEERLKSLSQRINGIIYSPDMINNWVKGVGNNFHCVITRNWGNLAKTNAWNGPARNSSGIVLQKDSAGSFQASLESFPKEIQELIKVQEPIYREMLSMAQKQT